MHTEAAIKYRDYLMDCVDYQSASWTYDGAGIRSGQAAVNVLYGYLGYNEVADILDVADPFHDDSVLPAFYTEVEYAFRARFDAGG